MTNLVMNAIRHTPADGTVEIRGRSVPDGVELSVSDQCGGISEADMQRVFDLAWRGGPARTPDSSDELAGVGGAGLGLAIVKGIVEAHRGDVRVENVAGPVGCVASWSGSRPEGSACRSRDRTPVRLDFSPQVRRRAGFSTTRRPVGPDVGGHP